MYILDTWRCSACNRILADRVIVSDSREGALTCWSCGVVNSLAEAVALAKGDVHESSIFEGPLPTVDARGIVKTEELIDAPVSPSKKHGKAQEAVSLQPER